MAAILSPVGILTLAQIRAGSEATPRPQLLQHEWAKHGSCVGDDPATFFVEEGRLFRAIHYPDMMTLAQPSQADRWRLSGCFSAANPGMRADMMAAQRQQKGLVGGGVAVSRLDKHPRTCPADQSGAKPDDLIKYTGGIIRD